MIETVIEEVSGIKRASGILRHGAIHISVPKRWGRQEKTEAITYLQKLLLKKAQKEARLLHVLDQWMSTPEGQSQLITIDNERTLLRYTQNLNAQTLRVPVAKVRIGQAKFSRLAQMNIETRTMTVSKYCLRGVPEPALRYLIVHELAHLIEANHSKRFWKLVAQHVGDYKQQSDIIKAFHKRAVDFEAEDGLERLKQSPQGIFQPPGNFSLSSFLPSTLAGQMINPFLTPRPSPIQTLPITPRAQPARQTQQAADENAMQTPSHLKRWWQLKLF